MKLKDLYEDWTTADDIEALWQGIKKIIKDKDLQSKILKVIKDIPADEIYDDDDMEDMWQGIKKIVPNEEDRKKILKLMQH